MVWFAKFPENLAVSIFKAKWLNSLEDGDSQILQRPQHGVLSHFYRKVGRTTITYTRFISPDKRKLLNLFQLTCQKLFTS
jgi:hypothetical protein